MKLVLAALLALTAVSAIPAAAQDSALAAALRQHRHALRMDEAGALHGPGATLLLEAGRQSRFFLIGEEHGVAQVPQLAAALFRELAPAGYRHLAIETGPWLASGLNQAARQGIGGIEAFVNRWWPGAPFYSLREEAELLAAAAQAAGGEAEVLWGLDYDIVADRYTLRRLHELAPTPAARQAAERVMAAADSMLHAALAAQNLAGVFMFAAPDSLLAGLRAAYAPAPRSEADEILRLMEATLAINREFITGSNYVSNQTRASLIKRHFVRRYRTAAAHGGAPRVMLKFGANHLQRGRTPVGTYDLGTLLPELAEMEGGTAFSLLAIGGRDRQKAVIDGRNFSYTAGPSDYLRTEWMAPVFGQALPEGWTLFDLRPLRTPLNAGQLGNVPPRLVSVIFGFDALLVIADSRPSTPLIGPPPPR